jgi:Glycosyltransferase family 87
MLLSRAPRCHCRARAAGIEYRRLSQWREDDSDDACGAGRPEDGEMSFALVKAFKNPKIYLPLAVLAVVISFIAVFRVPRDAPSDLYSPWYGTRQALFNGRNPYSAEVGREIQVGFYGHPLTPGANRDEQRFAYPLFTVFLLSPLAFFSFPTVNVVGFILLLLACLGVAWASVVFVGWPLDWKGRAFVVLAGLTTGAVLRVLRFEQLAALAALFLICGFLAARASRYVLAGALLALSTIKPQFAVLPIAWAFIWALSDWRNRKRLIQTFVVAFGALIVAAEVLLPGWIPDFVAQAEAYTRYAGDDSFLTLLAGKWIGAFCGIALAVAVAWFAWTQRKAGSETRGFELATAAVVALPAFVMPTMAAQHNQILLFPLVLIVFRNFRDFQRAFQISASALLIACPIVRLLSLLRSDASGKAWLVAAGVLFPFVAAIMMMRVCFLYLGTA